MSIRTSDIQSDTQCYENLGKPGLLHCPQVLQGQFWDNMIADDDKNAMVLSEKPGSRFGGKNYGKLSGIAEKNVPNLSLKRVLLFLSCHKSQKSGVVMLGIRIAI